MIVVLSGGSGGAKFVQGLQRIVPGRELTVIVNTGDDLLWWGLHVSPDLDSITYALAGMLSAQRGWGVEADTFQCLEAMRRIGAPAWFQLGDRDLATHLSRTQLLAQGKSLTQATQLLADSLGIESNVLPMTDARVETRVITDQGELSFQEYFVRERFQPRVSQVIFAGAHQARPSAAVLSAIAEADAVFIAPSNPVTSIGPILALPGLIEALQATPAPVAAVSPIVGGAAVSGPAGELMKCQGFPVSPLGVARAYQGFLDVLLVDCADEAELPALQRIGIRGIVAETIMKSLDDKVSLARAALKSVDSEKSAPVVAR
jgi:LPPG:FO 2-phospho-L-lactate transferase